MILSVHLRAIRAIIQRGMFGVFVLVVVWTLTPLAARADLGENPPRYHLKVGQKIEYVDRRESDVKEKRKDTYALTYWVVGENPDQSWRLVFHHVTDKSWINGEGIKETRRVGDRYGYFDLFADGRIVLGERAAHPSPELFFCDCPKNH